MDTELCHQSNSHLRATVEGAAFCLKRMHVLVCICTTVHKALHCVSLYMQQKVEGQYIYTFFFRLNEATDAIYAL